MKPIIYFLLICGIACNSPLKSKQEMSDSSSSQEDATQAASSNSSENASGGTANAGSAPAPGEESSNVTKGGNDAVSTTLRFKHYKYAIVSKGDGSGRTITIADTDTKIDSLKADSTTIHDVKGILQQTAIDDLDNDKNPEIYLFTAAEGTERTGSVYGVTYINNKGVRIFSGDIDNVDQKGYRGRDSFYIQQKYVVRTYPLYGDTDIDSKPTGGKRTIKYKLTKQGNSYMLKEAK
ncbi:hypothetical protein [Chitinophaga pinensis]|uniref:Uncharacterized protein n=1 Tax=Chitinophaga pinensis (strain ATCC 43595 / DSM 2588 / LMG 13176 / NBRC 15968 / NCIMB 11800 / UQM 2034) TaxID=485918 RepID=A0A979G4Q0_CHIPD|nr:hypothetical protein [Chitinophaga pinensis]ACU60810.1 hypothetical protein Cpin_3343 [Chitinophaga pinensis DSM 2588]